MNRSALKKYAPQARLDFIEAVTLRARRLGLDPSLPVNIEQTGDVLLIGGQPFPASIAKQRATLARRIQQQGFSVVVEALAYTWFNRLVAIRFMELKGYLNHGYRVLSHPEGQQPEILDNVQHLNLFGLDKVEVIRLKTAGNQDEVLYREILLAQCHELHRNMPFLFEALDDATELLLPDNLLRTDSPIARLVNDIEEDDWKEVEVIGWLYQFYISEKKEEVSGKVVKSEDIPAATQLFTPNWIVQYLVQNSLGRLWLMANPGSSLKEKMPYYIEPAKQTPEVQAQLDELIKVRMDEDGGSLNPESLTVLDPACGSGHILVEAYNLLRAIYEERGYRLRDIPRLILQKNLFGLDIDDRAAQLAGFALLMKGREDDRRLFDDEGNPPHLNVMAIQQSIGLPDEEMAQTIISAAIQIEGGEVFHSGQLFGGGQLEVQHSSGLNVLDLRQLIQLFEHGKTFGSLISVPDALKVKLGKIVDLLSTVRSQGDELSSNYASQVLEQFAWQASLLAVKYDAVVANPPYMGARSFNQVLKEYLRKKYVGYDKDLFSAFIASSFVLAKNTGCISIMTSFVWMFISSFEKLRKSLSHERVLSSLVQLEYDAFEDAKAHICAFVSFNRRCNDYVGSFIRLDDFKGAANQGPRTLEAIQNPQCGWLYETRVDEFSKIPGSPIAYWIKGFDLFRNNSMQNNFVSGGRNKTHGNDRYLRFWWEVSTGAEKWLSYANGGDFKKFFGNEEWVIDWSPEARNYYASHGGLSNQMFWGREGITWSLITSAITGFRLKRAAGQYSSGSPVIFSESKGVDLKALGFLNSKVAYYFLKAINPTINTTVNDVLNLPYSRDLVPDEVAGNVVRCVEIAEKNWNDSEFSSGFESLPLLGASCESNLISNAYLELERAAELNINKIRELETNSNRLIIESYGLQGELKPEVPSEQITLTRCGREKDMQRLISYIIGCMMGRYSLDESGLIYASSRSMDFDPSRYSKFPADVDGIVPITDEPWFVDDAAERVREFVKVVWGGGTLVDNMEWLADSLSRKSGESADQVIRRYLSTNFYKDHLQTYKKRPIYWLFSSGKQKAFECLVYLHRYNEGTLSRMRMEYVIPLQSRMQARIDKLADDISSATSSAQQKALQKRKDKFTKQLEELRRFDETLRPYADQRIALNLDDGVKVNYGKFGDLLAEVKVITGGKED